MHCDNCGGTLSFVDRTGKLFEIVNAVALERNAKQLHEDGKQVRPAFILERVAPPEDAEDELEFIWHPSERVRKKELFAFVIVPEDALGSEGDLKAPPAEIRYFTDTPTYSALPNWLVRVTDTAAKGLRFAEANVDQNMIRDLMVPLLIKKLELAERDASGAIVTGAERNELATHGIPTIGMMLLFMMVMTSIQPLLSSTLEEKINKIAEFLVSAVTPFELMMGKLIGAVLTAITLSSTYFLALIYIAHRYNVLHFVEPMLFVWFFVFLVLAMITFGAMCLAIGAACNELRDVQSLMFPIMIIIIVPLMAWPAVMDNPNSALAKGISLFPPATPMLMFLRIAIPPGVAWWEIALGLVGCFLFMLLAVWAASHGSWAIW